MIKRVVASLVAGASVGLLCAGVANGQADTRRGVLTWSDPITAVESPIRVDTREHASPHSTPLTVSLESMDDLRATERVLMIGFPLNAAELVDLDLRAISVFDPNAEIVSGHGPARTPAELGREGRTLMLGGEVAGAPGSNAFLAITPTGTNGFIRVDGHTHMISSGRHTTDAQPVIFNLTTLPEGTIEWKDFSCSAIDPATLRTLDDLEITPERAQRAAIELTGAAAMTGGGGGTALLLNEGDDTTEDDCRVVDVAIETDAELGAEFGAGDGAQDALLDYVETLVASVGFIYTTNINLQFNIIYTRDWLGQPIDADPWNGNSTADVLFELRAEWTPDDAPTSLNWQGVHLLSPRNLGGGIAFLGAICNQEIAHAVSANLNLFFPLDASDRPVSNLPQNWDLFVVAHEWGHNFGAPHTHGVEPSIDGCAFGDCSAADRGTIMSYCHLCPGGIANIELNFNQRIINEHIRPYIEGVAPCNLIQPSEACDVTPAPDCPADINGDGMLSGADFTAWIIAYNNNDPVADVNRDGRITPADFNAWIIAYYAGCDFGSG